nr:GntR family transcriptional regulator [uncultured Roseateles sp.]
MQTWTSNAPIYQQLAERLAGRLLDGEPDEGEAMPSVRTLASDYVLNPLTVSRALQTLVDEGVLETRRGVGMYVQPGARLRLRLAEREKFLKEEWPAIVEKLRRLGIKAHELNWEI